MNIAAYRIASEIEFARLMSRHTPGDDYLRTVAFLQWGFASMALVLTELGWDLEWIEVYR